MDPNIEAVLEEYERRAASEEATIARLHETGGMLEHRDEFLLSVGRSTGMLLNILATEARATRILEVGASYGYSTIWLAMAARATGGTVVSLELQPDKIAYGRERLSRVALDGFVESHVGDARETLATLPGPFDFVLIDLWKDVYVECFDLVYPKLSGAAFVAADNMITPASAHEHALAYREHVRLQPGIESILLPVGSGIELSRKSSL